MESGENHRTVYRLIVTVAGRERVYDAPPFVGFKPAMSNVATAIRASAAHGEVSAVALQRQARRNGHSPLPPRITTTTNGHRWTDVAHWDETVVRRILTQNPPQRETDGPPRPRRTSPKYHADHDPAPAALPCTPASTDHTAPSAKRRASRHVGGRWHLAATAGVMLLTWVVAALLVSGANPSRWLGPLRRSPATATDIPFAPRGAASRPSGVSLGPVGRQGPGAHAGARPQPPLEPAH